MRFSDVLKNPIIAVGLIALILIIFYYLYQSILTDLFVIFISFMIIDFVGSALLRGGKGFVKSPILGPQFISKGWAFLIFIIVILISTYLSPIVENFVYQQLGVSNFDVLTYL